MNHLRTALFAAILASTGCGLIDSDITNFDLTLPEKEFSIDTANWQVDGQQAMALLETDCSGAPTLCNQAAQMACAMDCSATCNSSTNTCDLSLDVGLYAMVDLINDKPELKAIDDQPVISVTVDSVKYEVTANTLNVDTPAIDLYVAPMSIMEPSSPEAKKIGTIEPVPAGATVASRDITFTEGGKAELVKIMSTFKTPFNVLVGSNLVVRSGQQLPMGRLDAVIRIKGHASAN